MFSKDFLNGEATYELNEFAETENKLDRNGLIYETGTTKKKDGFQKFKKIKSFGREIYNNELSLDNNLEQQIKLKDDIDIFEDSTKQKKSVKKRKKKHLSS